MTFTKADTRKVKGMAIIMMVLHHSFMMPERYKGMNVIFTPFAEEQFNWICWSFKICVAVFTFLSAFGITLSYKQENASYDLTADQTQRLILRRIIRLELNFIYIFLASLAFGLVMNPNLMAEKYGQDIKMWIWLLVDMTGLAQFFQTPTLLLTYWYISLALILIITMPFFLLLYRHFGGVALIGFSLLIVILFPVLHDKVTQPPTYAFFSRYVVCITLGILSADRDYPGKIRDWNPLGKGIIASFIKGTAEFLLIIGLLYTRFYVWGTTLLPVWEALLPLLICAFHLEYLNRIPVLSKILEILGIYSMDIFLIHNLIRARWFYDFTYSFGHWALIALVLLCDSLGVSFLLEKIKKLVRYNHLIGILESHV